MDIVIEKGVPLPQRQMPGGKAALLRSMDIGDSFLTTRSARPNFATTASRLGMKLAVRKIDEVTIRIWRVA